VPLLLQAPAALGRLELLLLDAWALLLLLLLVLLVVVSPQGGYMEAHPALLIDGWN
jgi:hypothetical protein